MNDQTIEKVSLRICLFSGLVTIIWSITSQYWASLIFLIAGIFVGNFYYSLVCVPESILDRPTARCFELEHQDSTRHRNRAALSSLYEFFIVGVWIAGLIFVMHSVGDSKTHPQIALSAFTVAGLSICAMVDELYSVTRIYSRRLLLWSLSASALSTGETVLDIPFPINPYLIVLITLIIGCGADVRKIFTPSPS